MSGGRRVVVTGMGAVSAAGNGVAALWESCLTGRSALRPDRPAASLPHATPTGRYPLECEQLTKRVAGRIEGTTTTGYNPTHPPKTHKDRLLRSADMLAQEIGESGIVVFTRSGLLPQTLSALRATRCPIYAFTANPLAFRHLLLVWGDEPFLRDIAAEPEQTIRDAFASLLRRGWVTPGDWMGVVTNVLAGEKTIDTIQLRPVE